MNAPERRLPLASDVLAGRDALSDLASLLPVGGLSRRGFVAAAGAGFALAAHPIQAQTVISTDARGLEAGEVEVPVPGGTMRAYVAGPAGGRKLATVLVVQEIFGLHEHIHDVARRLAHRGYLAIAPDLFQRQGDPARLSSNKEIFDQIVSRVPDAQVIADLDAMLAWAGRSGRGDPARAAITGFCWGGRIVWLYAAHNPQLRAGIAWYGRLVGAPTPLTPTHPVDVAARLKVPVLGLYGGADPGIPVSTVEQMREALAAAGHRASEIVVYPDMPHAFHADYRPSYRKDAADDGWRRLLAFLRQHGL